MQTTTTNEVIAGIEERRAAREIEERQDRQILEALYSDAMATADAAAAAFYALTGEHIALTESVQDTPETVQDVEPSVGPAPEWEPGEAESLAARIAREAPAAPGEAPEFEGPDPFSDDYYGSAAERAEDAQDEDSEDSEAARQRYEAKVLRGLEQNERATLYSAIMEAGGIETRDDLREEYRQIPNIYKRRGSGALAGDEMADHLATYYPQYGIETENDLLAYFTDRTAADRNRRAS